MKISIYAPYAKERFETARQHSFLHPERIGHSEVKLLPGNGRAASLALRVAIAQIDPQRRGRQSTYFVLLGVPEGRSQRSLSRLP